MAVSGRRPCGAAPARSRQPLAPRVGEGSLTGGWPSNPHSIRLRAKDRCSHRNPCRAQGGKGEAAPLRVAATPFPMAPATGLRCLTRPPRSPQVPSSGEMGRAKAPGGKGKSEPPTHREGPSQCPRSERKPRARPLFPGGGAQRLGFQASGTPPTGDRDRKPGTSHHKGRRIESARGTSPAGRLHLIKQRTQAQTPHSAPRV